MSSPIPVHASEHVLGGVSEYLATAFSLENPETPNALKAFLEDTERGMFHGPYVRARLPYARATGWDGILDWLPSWFTPYHHQAEAFRRLRSCDEHRERRPDPTLVITGTGSGETESFLYPVLDHAARARAEGHAGVKALLLHPMNALANDQADRGTPLNRKQRKQVWAVLKSLMQTQAIEGQLFWPTMSAVGAEMLNVRVERGGKVFV